MRIVKILCAFAAAVLLAFSCGSSEKAVQTYTIENAAGMKALFCPVGARLLSLEVPAADGSFKNVVWGCGSPEEALSDSNYRCTVVGRFGNRIAAGRFELDGKSYQLTQNEGETHLHGGTGGFSKKMWEVEQLSGSSLRMTCFSEDGDDGYPGNLTLSVTFTLSDGNSLDIEYSAETDAPTVLNPTMHFYFNLHGERKSITSHCLTINAENYTPVDSLLIPTGEISPVANTTYDYRTARCVNTDMDINFVLDSHSAEDPVEPALVLSEPGTGIRMEVFTDRPGLQIYSGNENGGLVVETQNFPDSPNHGTFPPVVLRPGDTYTQTSSFKFSVEQ